MIGMLNVNNSFVRINLIGDIFPGETAFTLQYGIKSQFDKHKGKPWISKIKNLLEGSDITIGNLESPLIDDDKTNKRTFYGHPEFAEFLKECRINVINVANNHILEQGSMGFDSTIKVIEKSGLHVVGNYHGNLPNIKLLRVKNINIAIAGFSNVDLIKINNDNKFIELNEDIVIKAIELMKARAADIKIISLHWGHEYIQFPSFDQRLMAYSLLKRGRILLQAIILM
jgi:poly-gamma-glutamate synthesis protein (capsule biosynthesis protein)